MYPINYFATSYICTEIANKQIKKIVQKIFLVPVISDCLYCNKCWNDYRIKRVAAIVTNLAAIVRFENERWKKRQRK